MFSDWRNKPKVDYSTNAVVTDWYGGGPSKYIRGKDMQEMDERLTRGERVTIGIDYYAFFYPQGKFNLTPAQWQYLAQGGVIIWEQNVPR